MMEEVGLVGLEAGLMSRGGRGEMGHLKFLYRKGEIGKNGIRQDWEY